MEHTAEVLRTADRALSTAYMAKTGMTEAEALDMMEKETWLTAEQAKERGLINEVMFEKQEKCGGSVPFPRVSFYLRIPSFAIRAR